MTEHVTATRTPTEDEIRRGKALGFNGDDITKFVKRAAARAEPAHWNHLFPDGNDRLTLPLLTEAEEVKGLDARLDDVLKTYNTNSQNGVTVQKDPDDKTKLILKRGRNAPRHISLTQFLRNIDDAEPWLLAYDLEVEWNKQNSKAQPVEAAKPAPAEVPHEKLKFEDIKHTDSQAVDGCFNNDDLRVVISREPIDIAGMSTGRRWSSCTAKGRSNHHYVPKEIQAGTLVAYLVHKDDTDVKFPLMRVLLKPFANEMGETILVPSYVYPADMSGNSITEAALLHTVSEFARTHNNVKTGTYHMDVNEVYSDGQETTVELGKQTQTVNELATAIARAIPSKVTEYITEIEAGNDRILAGEYVQQNTTHINIYTDKLMKLFAEPATRASAYLCCLRDMNIGQQLPKPSEVLEAMEAVAVVQARFASSRFKEHQAFVTLKFNDDISNLGVEKLALVLARNPVCTTLELWDNHIDDVGAEKLAEMLTKNTNLAKLGLYGNKIGDVGAAQLAEALKKNTTLTTLDLSCNPIGVVGAKVLGEALTQNTTLTNLKLWCTDQAIIDALAETLDKNTTLTTLKLYTGFDSGVDLSKLIQGLKNNKNLVEFENDANRLPPTEIWNHTVRNRNATIKCIDKIRWINPLSSADKQEIVARSNAILHMLPQWALPEDCVHVRDSVAKIRAEYKEQRQEGGTWGESIISGRTSTASWPSP